MNITEHEMRGLLTGKCLPGDMRVNEELPAYLVRKFAELKAERDAMADENAIMLKLLTDISENHVEYFSEGESGMFAGVPLDYVSEINMYVSRDVNAENPFPATDAYLNSVRAEGVEMFANEKLKLSELHARNRDIEMVKANDYCAMTAEDFAAQLRAGKDGES